MRRPITSRRMRAAPRSRMSCLRSQRSFGIFIKWRAAACARKCNWSSLLKTAWCIYSMGFAWIATHGPPSRLLSRWPKTRLSTAARRSCGLIQRRSQNCCTGKWLRRPHAILLAKVLPPAQGRPPVKSSLARLRRNRVPRATRPVS